MANNPEHHALGLLPRTIARALSLVAPAAASRYVTNHYRLRNYMAASKKGPNAAWIPTTQTADAILRTDRATIVARARDLVRNSAHIAGAINKLVHNILYTGIHPQAQFTTPDGQTNSALADTLEAHWESWADAVDWYSIQSLILRHELIDGECLILWSVNNDLRKQGICPLWPEPLECDHLDDTHDTQTISTKNTPSGNRVRGGIEYDSYNRPIAYYLRREHPGAAASLSMDSQRIPAERITHIFERTRATQSRGVSRLAPVIMEMRDFAEYQSSERIAARLAAAFGIFVESQYPEHLMMNPLADPAQAEAVNSAIPKYLESGRIDVLPPGMKISVAENKRPGSNYADFSRTSLRGASAGTGLSYETFSNDYSEATYSSARAATLEERRSYRTIQAHLNRSLNTPTWKRWCTLLNASGIMGLASPPPVIWQNPGWPWVDPIKDAKAAELELALGITTRRKLAAERGEDWDEVVQELAAEQTKMESLGLTLDPSDPEDPFDTDPQEDTQP